MIRRQPRSTRTYTPCPSTTLFRSPLRDVAAAERHRSTGTGVAGGHRRRHAEDGGDQRQLRGRADGVGRARQMRSEEHTSELQSLMRISYAVFCLKKKHVHSFINTILKYTPYF